MSDKDDWGMTGPEFYELMTGQKPRKKPRLEDKFLGDDAGALGFLLGIFLNANEFRPLQEPRFYAVAMRQEQGDMLLIMDNGMVAGCVNPTRYRGVPGWYEATELLPD